MENRRCQQELPSICPKAGLGQSVMIQKTSEKFEISSFLPYRFSHSLYQYFSPFPPLSKIRFLNQTAGFCQLYFANFVTISTLKVLFISLVDFWYHTTPKQLRIAYNQVENMAQMQYPINKQNSNWPLNIKMYKKTCCVWLNGNFQVVFKESTLEQLNYEMIRA